MLWRYKFEAEMDCNDGDYARNNGNLGTFDDANLKDMLKVHLQMMYMNSYAEVFDDGYADEEKVMKHFYNEAHSYGITDDELNAFIEHDLMDEYEWLPDDPNDDSNAHDLSFAFSRVPADVKEEIVNAHNITYYTKRSPITSKED